MMGNNDCSQTRRWNRAAAFWIIGAALLFFHGRIVSSDEMLMARLAAAIGREGHLSFPELHGRTTSPYGVIPSLLGIPWLWLQILLERIGLWGGDEAPVLLAMSNIFLMIPLAICVLRLSKRWGASTGASAAAAMLLAAATPYFVYSQTFFSEIPAALCLAAAAWRLGVGFPGLDCIRENKRLPADSRSPGAGEAAGSSEALEIHTPPEFSLPLGGLWIGAALHVRVITGALWPFWFLWVGRVLWRRHRDISETAVQFGGFLAGPALAAAGVLALNWGLRGNILNFGYETSDFTTPWATGLDGLLFSPDRGLALQLPLAWLLLAAWITKSKSRPAASIFTISLGVFWLILHAAFWTWHGGWTPGPRFLLPLIPLFFPPFAVWLDNPRAWSAAKRAAIYAFSLAGFILAAAQNLRNPMDWNNELFGFLNRTETRFLFEPHVSAWRGVWTLLGDAFYGGAHLRPVWLSGSEVDLPFAVRAAFPLCGLAFIVIGIFAAPRNALRSAVQCESRIVARWFAGPGRAAGAAILASVICLAAAKMISGPRGLEHSVSPAPHSSIEIKDFDRRMRWSEPPRAHPDRASVSPEHTWRGYIELPLDGEYVLYLKARGTYDVRIAGKTIFENLDANKPQHLDAKTIQLKPGMYPVKIHFKPSAPGDGLLYFYWQWPGEGRILDPWDGEYLWPDTPSGGALAAAKLWRRGKILAVGVIFMGLMLSVRGKKRR